MLKRERNSFFWLKTMLSRVPWYSKGNLPLVAFAFCLFVLSSQSDAANNVQSNEISSPVDVRLVRSHLEFLSDDLLLGRKPGEKGFDIAALYAKTQFQAYGLQPLSGLQGYGSQVDLVLSNRTEGTEQLTFGNCDVAPDDPSLSFGAVLNGSEEEEVDAEAVFVGYGIEDPTYGLRPYEGLDVDGKVVVYLNGFPPNLPGEVGAHHMLRKPVYAYQHGALATVEIETISSLSRRPWLLIRQTFGGSVERLHNAGEVISAHSGRASLRTTSPLSECFFENSPWDLPSILRQAENEANTNIESFELNASIRYRRRNSSLRYSSENVIATVDAVNTDGDTANPTILVLAHLDHIGFVDRGTDREIFNGTLDNAMGSAIVLEVARTIAKSRKRLKKNVVFALLTAEESGMLGSAQLASRLIDQHGVRIDSVVNVDMPVLLHPLSEVIAIGANHSTMGAVVTTSAKELGLSHQPDPNPRAGRFTRSDHYRFVEKGIPAVSLAVGRSGDIAGNGARFRKAGYHTPRDDLSLPIDWNAVQKFSEFVSLLVFNLASTEERQRWYSDSVFGNEFAPAAKKMTRN